MVIILSLCGERNERQSNLLKVVVSRRSLRRSTPRDDKESCVIFDTTNVCRSNIDIDGAGYKEDKSAFPFYGLPKEIKKNANDVISKLNGRTNGVQIKFKEE